MARILTNGRVVHPDELRARGRLEPEPDPVQLEMERLEAAGWRKDDRSNWWSGPAGERANGRRAALAHLEG